jgi:hypothetical protein
MPQVDSPETDLDLRLTIDRSADPVDWDDTILRFLDRLEKRSSGPDAAIRQWTKPTL